MNEFKEKLDENKNKYDVVIRNFRKTYLLYKQDESSTEYLNMYTNNKNQLKDIFSELFLIENNIEKKSNKIIKTVKNNENTIETNKEIYLRNKKKLDNIISINKASKPRENDYKNLLKMQYIYIGINIIGILGSSGLIYKVFN